MCHDRGSSGPSLDILNFVYRQKQKGKSITRTRLWECLLLLLLCGCLLVFAVRGVVALRTLGVVLTPDPFDPFAHAQGC